MTKKYTALLFDADNTLLDFDMAENQGLKSVMADYNVPVTDENCKKYSEINSALWKRFEKGEITKADIKITRFKTFFKFLGIKDEVDPIKVNETYLGYLGEGGFTIEGAVDLCESLKRKGYDLYIVTNGIASTQAKRLQKSGLLPYFTKVFVSENVGYQKPMKEFFDFVLDNISEKDKGRVLVIGDSLSSDIKGARNAGLDYIWYNHDKLSVPDDLNAVVVIDDIRELNNIL